MMTEFAGGIVIIFVLFWLTIGICIGLSFSMLKDAQYEYKIKQCLMMSGTEWREGSCVIKIK